MDETTTRRRSVARPRVSLSTCVYAGYKDIHIGVDELIRHVITAGYRNIEVSAWNMLEDWPLKDLTRKASDAGISIPTVHCTHHYDLDMVGRDFHQRPIGGRDKEAVFREFHEQFYQALEGAGLGGVVIVEHLPTSESQLDYALRRLSVLREINEKHGFTITIENMPAPGREEQLRVLRRLLQEEGIYYCHDINHAAIAGFEPFDFVEFLPRLRNVHVVDNNPLIRFGDGVAPGLGAVPMRKVLARMLEGGYAGPFTVEIYGFERELQEVLDMCQRALATVHPGRSDKLSEAVGGLDWRDVLATYSREWLERVLEEMI